MKHVVLQCNSQQLRGNGACLRGASSAQGSGSGCGLAICRRLPSEIPVTRRSRIGRIRPVSRSRTGHVPYERVSASRPKCAVVASKVFRTVLPSIRAAIEASGPVKALRCVIKVPESVGSVR